jgi:hypothetical protein
MPDDLKSKLPRLARAFYQGPAMVLWTHTMVDRAAGWLSAAFHQRFREILLHASHRYQLACPCYVLMPDHWHIVWMGLAPHSDQWLATAFLRKHLQPLPGSAQFQDRAHDHVLRENEREHGAFAAACVYVCQNPERAGLCSEWPDWPHLGCLVPAYPELDPRSPNFWETFWRIHLRLVDGISSSPLPSLVARSVRSGRSDSDPCAHAQGYKPQNPLPRSPLREQRDALPNPCAHAQGHEAQGDTADSQP